MKYACVKCGCLFEKMATSVKMCPICGTVNEQKMDRGLAKIRLFADLYGMSPAKINKLVPKEKQ